MIDYKFVIKYSYVWYISRTNIQKSSTFYKVKIIQGHYDHTIRLSEVFYKQVIHVYRGHVKLNFDCMNKLLVILKKHHQQIQIFLSIDIEIYPSQEATR